MHVWITSIWVNQRNEFEHTAHGTVDAAKDHGEGRGGVLTWTKHEDSKGELKRLEGASFTVEEGSVVVERVDVHHPDWFVRHLTTQP